MAVLLSQYCSARSGRSPTENSETLHHTTSELPGPDADGGAGVAMTGLC